MNALELLKLKEEESTTLSTYSKASMFSAAKLKMYMNGKEFSRLDMQLDKCKKI